MARTEKLIETIQWHQDLFGEDYYLELQRHPMSEEDLQSDGMLSGILAYQQYQDYIAKQDKVNQTLLGISQRNSIFLSWPQMIAITSIAKIGGLMKSYSISSRANLVKYWEKDSHGNPKFAIPNPKRRTYSSHECYFKSPQQMEALFQDIPEAISNTLKIAEKCNVEIDFKTKHYPIYIPPSLEGKTYTKEEQLRRLKNSFGSYAKKGFPIDIPRTLAKVEEIYPDRTYESRARSLKL